MAKTVKDYKAKHDQSTIIARLQGELTRAQSEASLMDVARDALGVASNQFANATPPAWALKAQPAGSPGVPLLFLSDLHWGEIVKPEQVAGVNKFNMSIAHDRLRYTIHTATHLLRILDGGMNYPGIVVLLGGDMISGNIHEELTATNELNTMPTVLDLYEQLIGAITALADTFKNVRLVCVSGNHGRDTRKTWAKDRNATSFDWLLYQFLGRHFKSDSRVSFYIPDGSDALFKVYDKRYLLTHGDQFKAGDSLIGPLGPLARGSQKKLTRNQAVGQDFDIMCAGHWHTYIHMEYMIVNGSLKGYDEYAAQGNFRFEPPRQALWLNHERFGVTYRMPVLCEPPPKGGRKVEWISVAK